MKVHITLVLILLIGFTYAQQQPLYTNYLMNQYIYNPAYAGVEDGTQFNLGYRNQWVGFDGGPKTLLLSGYGKLKKKPNMAIGGILTTERMGLLQRTTFYGTYSYHLKINKKAAINFGLGLGGIQHKVRVYDSRPYDKDDAFLGSDVLSAFAFDANAGFYFYTKNFYLGFSDQQMPNSRILWDKSTGKNTNHFYAYIGYNIHVNKEWVIQPSVLVRTNSPAPYQFEGLLKLIYDDMFWAGLSYRQKSSASFMFGCKIDKKYSFGYAYDLILTDISKYSSGSHEIVLSYLIPFKKKKSKSDMVKDADEEELNKIDNSLKTNLKNKKKKEGEKKDGTNGTENKPEGTQPEVKPGTGAGGETPVEITPEPQADKPAETSTPATETPAAPTSNSEPQAEKPVETVAPASETPAAPAGELKTDKPAETETPKPGEGQSEIKTPEVEPKKEEPKH